MKSGGNDRFEAAEVHASRRHFSPQPERRDVRWGRRRVAQDAGTKIPQDGITGCCRGSLTGSATTKRAGDVRQIDVAPPGQVHARVHGTGVQQRSATLVNDFSGGSCIADAMPTLGPAATHD